MDRTRKPRGRRAGVALLLGAWAGPFSGCAYMHGIRGGAPEFVGAAAPTVDPYLVHHRSGTPAKPPGGGAALASVEPEVAPSSFARSADRVKSDASGEGIVPTEVVSLGTPVALPTASHPRPAPAAAEEPRDDARSVVARARAAVEAMTTYQVAMNRQERVGGVLLPVEDVRLSVRRSPKAVRLEWPAGAHKGREVLYSASEGGGLLHVHMGDSLVPVPDLSLSPDSPMVMKNSRHPITEAGFDAVVATLEQCGPSSKYLGLRTPPALGRACHGIEWKSAGGESWLFYLDAQTALPAMVEGTSGSGELLERYLFRDVKPDVAELAAADAFDPSKRWGTSTAAGLLGRLARTGGDAKTTTTTAPR